jgi:hypothetical protein
MSGWFFFFLPYVLLNSDIVSLDTSLYSLSPRFNTVMESTNLEIYWLVFLENWTDEEIYSIFLKHKIFLKNDGVNDRGRKTKRS